MAEKTLILNYVKETEKVKVGNETINSVFDTKEVLSSFLPDVNPKAKYTLREMKDAFSILEKLEDENATSIELTQTQVQLLYRMADASTFNILSKNLISLIDSFEEYLKDKT